MTDPIQEFMAMVKKDIQTITDPNEMAALGTVIVHVLAPEPQDNER